MSAPSTLVIDEFTPATHELQSRWRNKRLEYRANSTFRRNTIESILVILFSAAAGFFQPSAFRDLVFSN